MHFPKLRDHVNQWKNQHGKTWQQKKRTVTQKTETMITEEGGKTKTKSEWMHIDFIWFDAMQFNRLITELTQADSHNEHTSVHTHSYGQNNCCCLIKRSCLSEYRKYVNRFEVIHQVLRRVSCVCVWVHTSRIEHFIESFYAAQKKCNRTNLLDTIVHIHITYKISRTHLANVEYRMSWASHFDIICLFVRGRVYFSTFKLVSKWTEIDLFQFQFINLS